MADVRLDQAIVYRPEVAQCLQAGQAPQAEQLAREAASTAMADLAMTQLHQRRVPETVKLLQDALNLCPSNQRVFHNLAAVLLAERLLRGKNLDSLAQFIVDHLQRFPWVRAYQALAVLPGFVNLEFVSGKCNLNCRMCLGRKSGSYPNIFQAMSAATFERMLAAVPTAGALTLTGADSDPLLHPQFEQMLDTAAAAGVTVDIFTNGHALTEAVTLKIVQSGAVNMINFSLDAARPETYTRIRGASLQHVLEKIAKLIALKAEAGKSRPGLSLSFVAMADNIEELPEFVRLALRLRAWRVYVEYINGWDDAESGNLVPSRNERYAESVRAAQAAAAGTNLWLSLPERMLAEVGATGGGPAPAKSPEPQAAPGDQPLQCCGWLRGVFVTRDGGIDPCCMVQDAADMGSVYDGPLHQNAKYLRVKGLLSTGRVFKKCLEARMCPYVQQRLAAGAALTLISEEDLGADCLPAKRKLPPPPNANSPMRRAPTQATCTAG